MKHLNFNHCNQVSGGFFWSNVPPPVIDPVVLTITEGNLINAFVGFVGFTTGMLVGSLIQRKVDYILSLENMVNYKNENCH